MSLKNFLLDCLFPKQCYGCRCGGTFLCHDCFLKLKKYQGEVPRALKNTKDLIIAGDYKDPMLRDLIAAYKFNFNRELAIPLFAFLKPNIDTKIMINDLLKHPWQNILVIPIPLHKKRLAWRGFNQSELLAREISNYFGWPLSLNLKKIKNTAVQADLNEDARLKNQAGVFSWHGPALSECDIILVDDIITSGATINEAELILIAAGANRVIKIAIAKG